MKSNICWLCDKNFGNINDKIRHCCKLTGNYLGAAHQSCIAYVNKVGQHKFIPVLYHNFSKNDNHMFFNDLINSKVDKINQSVIPRLTKNTCQSNTDVLTF